MERMKKSVEFLFGAPRKTLVFWGKGAVTENQKNWGPRKTLVFWGRGAAMERMKKSVFTTDF